MKNLLKIKLDQKSDIVIFIVFNLFSLLLFSSCNIETEYPNSANYPEITDFHFCSTEDGICDSEESRDTFDATEWEKIVACGIIEVEGAPKARLNQYWFDDMGNVITSGPGGIFNDGEMICFSLFESINYEATIIDDILNTNVISDGKMEPGLYFLAIKEFRVVNNAIAFTIRD